MTPTDDLVSEPIPRVPRTEVRRRLLAAAARIFAERGYADSRLEDIAYAAGFSKGAVYSNFGGKQDLFGAILGERADTELVAVVNDADDGRDLGEVAGHAARAVARRIVEDTERGRLGLEFAARAARDEQARSVLTPLRRAQREAAARAVTQVTERGGIRPAVDPELAALILHCLTNGLSMEHLADPEVVDSATAEQALHAVLRWLTNAPPTD
ncbi:TetR/AcrR family transcriptional regulator [Nocardia sp. NPDC003963]